MYRLMSRRSGSLPAYLAADRLSQVLDMDMPYTRQWFHHDVVSDPGAYNRLMTVEYLYQHYNAGNAENPV